jgi:hypothetical protein
MMAIGVLRHAAAISTQFGKETNGNIDIYKEMPIRL